MNTWIEALVALFLLLGSLFALVGSIGLYRLPDFFMRLHGPTKAKLERIIVAWGGEVTDSLTYHTTHWVFEHSDDFHDVVAKHEQTNASASLSPEPEKITVEQFLAKLA